MSENHAGLAAGLAKLLETGQFSDLKILCGDAEFAVHKNVICCQSKPLMAMCTNGMKESQESIIDLTIDTEPCVSRLVDFLYRCDYEALEPDSKEAALEKGATSTEAFLRWEETEYPETSTGTDKQPARDDKHVPVTTRQLSLHVDMYVLADKYDIASLGDLAIKKFQAAAAQAHRERDARPSITNKLPVLETIPHIYALTSDQHNRGLRDVVVEDCRLRRATTAGSSDAAFFAAELGKLFDTVPDFAADVLRSWLQTPFLGRCRTAGCERVVRDQDVACGSCCENHRRDDGNFPGSSRSPVEHTPWSPYTLEL